LSSLSNAARIVLYVSPIPSITTTIPSLKDAWGIFIYIISLPGLFDTNKGGCIEAFRDDHKVQYFLASLHLISVPKKTMIGMMNLKNPKVIAPLN